jgi:hypothetical protein
MGMKKYFQGAVERGRSIYKRVGKERSFVVVE